MPKYKQIVVSDAFFEKLLAVSAAKGQTIKGYIETSLLPKLNKEYEKLQAKIKDGK